MIPLIIRFGLVIAILIGWQLTGDDSASINMPTITRTLSSFSQMVASGELFTALMHSNLAMICGYLLSLVIGIPLGVAMATSKLFDKVVAPYLTVLLATPLIATLPLLQAFFGLGFTTRVVVVFIFCFVYFAVNTATGIRAIPHDLNEMARSLRASRWQWFYHVALPHAFPAIMAGSRLAIGRAVVGMVVAELFLTSSGLGSLLTFYMTRFDSAAVLVIALTMVAEGILLVALARWLENYIVGRTP